jgi:hypothetical protein
VDYDTDRALVDFVAALEGWSLDLEFDPADPASVERAIEAMEKYISGTAALFPEDQSVTDLAEQMKAQCRAAIRDHRGDDPIKTWFPKSCR